MNDSFFTDEKRGLKSCSDSIINVFLQKEKAIRAWDKANNGKLDSDMTRDDYISLFNAIGIRRKTSFVQYRMALCRYVSYQIESGRFSENQMQILKSVNLEDLSAVDSNATSGGKKLAYFRNLNDLRFCVEETAKDPERDNTGKFDPHMSACYLAWFGLTMEQMCELKKSDVLENGILLGGKFMELPQFVADQLNDYKDSRGFNQQARGVIFHTYQASEYLFRTERSSHITTQQLYQLLKRFNAIMDGRYSLTYNVIHTSGIFNRAHALEVEIRTFDLNDRAFAERVFETTFENDQAYRNALSDYAHYKKLFY